MGQINLLERALKEAAQAYYNDGTSTISDTAFDLAQEKLREEKPNSSVVVDTGWGYDVFKDTTPGDKVQHIYGLVGSLGKAYNWSEVSSSLKNQPVDVSLKLDGLSVVLYYQAGCLVSAVTRGDGTTGINIIDKVDQIVNEKEKKLKDSSFTGAVRGELLMKKSDWEKFKKLHPEAKNSRNSTAGLINAKEISPDLKFVTLVVYKVVGSASKPNLAMPTMNVWLAQNFCNTAPSVMGGVLIEADCEKFNELLHILNPDDFLPVDGLVMKYRDLKWDETTGEVIYNEQAFKFPAEVAITSVVDVEWNLSKNRYLVPRINLDTVHISGTDVSWCTGYNAQYIKENGIGKDAVVTVEKHGEIIPNINEIVVSVDPAIPTKCPVCGSDLEWEGVHLKCTNESCDNAKIQDLLVWVNTLAPMENFGDALRLKFLKEHFSEISIEEIMDPDPSKFVIVGGGRTVGKKMFFDMMTTLRDFGRFDLLDAIKALNIPRIADANAQKVKTFITSRLNDGYTYEEIINYMLSNHAYPELAKAVGDANAKSIVANPEKLKRLLLISDRILKPVHENTEYELVAVTGKLSVKRSDFEKELLDHGYKIGDVSKHTKVLITDDPNSASSKNQKAEKLGVRKMTEAQFREEFLHE